MNATGIPAPNELARKITKFIWQLAGLEYTQRFNGYSYEEMVREIRKMISEEFVKSH